MKVVLKLFRKGAGHLKPKKIEYLQIEKVIEAKNIFFRNFWTLEASNFRKAHVTSKKQEGKSWSFHHKISQLRQMLTSLLRAIQTL